MPKYKCVLLRSQYQTVEVEAESYRAAEVLAKEMFNTEEMINAEFIEVYDMEEINEEK